MGKASVGRDVDRARHARRTVPLPIVDERARIEVSVAGVVGHEANAERASGRDGHGRAEPTRRAVGPSWQCVVRGEGRTCKERVAKGASKVEVADGAHGCASARGIARTTAGIDERVVDADGIAISVESDVSVGLSLRERLDVRNEEVVELFADESRPFVREKLEIERSAQGVCRDVYFDLDACRIVGKFRRDPRARGARFGKTIRRVARVALVEIAGHRATCRRIARRTRRKHQHPASFLRFVVRAKLGQNAVTEVEFRQLRRIRRDIAAIGEHPLCGLDKLAHADGLGGFDGIFAVEHEAHVAWRGRLIDELVAIFIRGFGRKSAIIHTTIGCPCGRGDLDRARIHVWIAIVAVHFVFRIAVAIVVFVEQTWVAKHAAAHSAGCRREDDVAPGAPGAPGPPEAPHAARLGAATKGTFF